MSHCCHFNYQRIVLPNNISISCYTAFCISEYMNITHQHHSPLCCFCSLHTQCTTSNTFSDKYLSQPQTLCSHSQRLCSLSLLQHCRVVHQHAAHYSYPAFQKTLFLSRVCLCYFWKYLSHSIPLRRLLQRLPEASSLVETLLPTSFHKVASRRYLVRACYHISCDTESTSG